MYKLEIELQRIKKLQGCDFSDPDTQREVFGLLETLFGMIIELRKENQELRDEINRLKGEKGKPTFKPNNDLHPNREKGNGTLEPGLTKKWVKGSKRAKIKIDRTEVIELDRSNLPDGIEFKGYEEKVIQNIILKTDNVLYRLEKYYSPSLKKTYTAELEKSLKNTEFGAETKALISALYYENRVTENKIASFLNANGLHISEGTVSNILIKAENEALNVIKNKVFEAGLASSVYQQIDDTGMKVSKKNAYATIVCNEKHSTFFINTSKSRETIKTFMPSCLSSMFTVLVGDDAPQFKGISERYALCWVHEERHYKKLTPILEYHRKELNRVRYEIWNYYAKLKDYKENPTEQKKVGLWEEFDILFGQKTYYDELNKRLSLTLEKKSELLTVLEYPEVPLHNNLSENGVREIVMKRKISGGIKTDEGARAWENNMSILATCKKLGVNFFDFMKDVFAKNLTVNLHELVSR